MPESKERKQCFFEKNNQKTFIRWRGRTDGATSPARAALLKVFWFFFSKKNCFAFLLLLLVIAMAASAALLFPADPHALAGRPLTPPFTRPGLLLGTDAVGRDIAAQLFYGARIALLIGLAATAIAVAIGVAIGAIAGYFGGWADMLLMRIAESFQIVPSFLLLLLLVAVFGSRLSTVVVAIGLVSWPAQARLARAEVLILRGRDFVQAGRLAGMGHARLLFREILPNALPPLIVYASVVMATAILLESSLAFLGLSDPNASSWGNLVGDGRRVLRAAPYVAAIPGLAILATVLSISLLGQRLNDVLNPRL
jgi:peptide/nickel transport system permease protein